LPRGSGKPPFLHLARRDNGSPQQILSRKPPGRANLTQRAAVAGAGKPPVAPIGGAAI
jgi:hypothetical protein